MYYTFFKQSLIYFKLIYMIYIIYIQRFTNAHLKTKPKFDLIYINLYNFNLYLLIHLFMSCTAHRSAKLELAL